MARGKEDEDVAGRELLLDRRIENLAAVQVLVRPELEDAGFHTPA
jgi:hypothetical protein